MQLGVAHALLVTRAQAPNAVVGVSAGAINAAALAEILQAGGTLSDPEDQLSVKIDRLREFINAYHEVRRTLTDAILPDSLEVFASNPLKPLESPLQFAEERATRAKANEAKSGLIDLLNAFFRIRLPVSAVTVMGAPFPDRRNLRRGPLGGDLVRQLAVVPPGGWPTGRQPAIFSRAGH